MRGYAAVTSGVLAGVVTIGSLWIGTGMDICAIAFSGFGIFSLVSVGFMALTESRVIDE